MKKITIFAVLIILLSIIQTTFANTELEESLRYFGLAEKATPQDVQRLSEIKLRLENKRLTPKVSSQEWRELLTDILEIYKTIYKLRGVTPMPTDQQLQPGINGIAAVSLSRFLDCSVPASNKTTPAGQIGKFEKFGKGKTTLILLPGAFTNETLFKSFVTRNENLYTMYLINLPGDAGSAPPPKAENFNPIATPWWDNAEVALVKFIQKQKLEKPIIVGIERGSYLAAKMALNYPEKIGSVILLNGMVYPSSMRSPSNPERMATLEERKQASINRNFATAIIYDLLPNRMPDRACAESYLNANIKLFEQSMLSMTRDIERAKQIYVESITTSNPRSIQYTNELTYYDLTEDLKSLKVPMLSIPAVRDYESPPNIFAYPQWSDVKARYPNIPLTVAPFQNTRGYINEEAPKELDQAIADFLAGKTDIKGKPAKRSDRLSPRASVTQEFGNNNIAIVYGRPQVKNRKVWGELVPLGRVWRSGADEATTITFANDVMIEGQKLAAGKYTFFTIPTENEWTLIFNKSQYQWGAFYYSSDLDILRVKVKPQPAEHEESVRYYFNYLSPTSAEMVLHWEKIKVVAKIETVGKQ